MTWVLILLLRYPFCPFEDDFPRFRAFLVSKDFEVSAGRAINLKGNQRDKLGTNGANSQFFLQIFADFRFSWEAQPFGAADFRRKRQEPQIFAENGRNRRFSQKTAGTADLQKKPQIFTNFKTFIPATEPPDPRRVSEEVS